MATDVEYELEAIKAEMRSIISELEDISRGVRNDFVGVGNDLCSNCIDRAVSQYYNVLGKLNRINLAEFDLTQLVT